jgi:hypothetical protein
VTVGRGRGDIGHQDVEVALEGDEEQVQLGTGLGLRPGQAQRGLSLVHGAVHLDPG